MSVCVCVCGNCIRHTHTARPVFKSSEEGWVEYPGRGEVKEEEERKGGEETRKEGKEVCTRRERKAEKEGEGRE